MYSPLPKNNKVRFNHPELNRRYRWIKKLGEGGLGIVNLAQDAFTGQGVAIKSQFTKFLSNEETLNRFQIENNIYAKLNHPSIVKLKNFLLLEDPEKPEAHSVLEFVNGQTLEDYIHKKYGPLPYKKAISVFIKILEGIGYAHNTEILIDGFNGILHLDIKPSNIMISNSDEVKVLDYGISRGKEEEAADVIMGSPSYMSPEQLTIGVSLDQRTDIYSLGVLLHHMLTGRRPCYSDTKTTYNGYNAELYAQMICEEELSRLETIYPYPNKIKYIQDQLQYIIDKATAKDSDDRYQDCDEFIDDLKNLTYDYA